MSHPTGDHESAAKLAAGYVEVNVKYAQGMEKIHKDFDDVEAHAKTTGAAAGASIVEAVSAAGVPAAQGFADKLAETGATATREASGTVADAFREGVVGALQDAGIQAGDGASKSVVGSFMDGVRQGFRESRIGDDIDYVFNGAKEKSAMGGQQAADGFMGRWIQVFKAGGKDAEGAGSAVGEAAKSGIAKSLAGLDAAGIGAAMEKLRDQQLDSRRNVLALQQDYQRMSSDAATSVDALTAKHKELSAAQQEAKNGALDVATASNLYRSKSREEKDGEGLGVGETLSRAAESKGKITEGVQSGLEGGLGIEGVLGIGKALGALTNPAVLATAAVVGVAGATAGVLEKVNEMGEGWEEVFHNVQIQTGATGEKLEGLEGNVKSVVGQVTLSKEQVGSIVSSVATSFKDTGDGVTKVSTEVGKLESMVGQVDLTSLGKGFRGFGIGGDADQQVAVLNQLFKATQATQIPINTLVDAMGRAAPIANQFHLSIGATAAVMSQFDAAGIDPSRTMFSLAKAAQEATKQHKDFSTVLSDEIEQIRAAGKVSEQAGLDKAGEFFGKTSGRGGAAQIFQAVQQGLTLDPALLSQIENAKGLIDQTRASTETWGDKWTLLKGQISSALEPATAGVHKLIDDDLQQLTAWIGSHQKDIVSFFVDIGVAAVNMAAFAIKAFGELLNGIGGLTNALATTLAAFAGLADAVGAHGVADDLGNVAQSLKNAGDNMDQFGKNAVTFADDQAPKLIDALEGARADADKSAGSIGAAAGKVNDFSGAMSGIPPSKSVTFTTPGLDDAVKEMKDFNDAYTKFLSNDANAPGAVTPPPGSTVPPPGTAPGLGGLYALIPHQYGGPIVHARNGIALNGYGGGDIVPAMLEPGEHVWTKEETEAVGGHKDMFLLRALAKHGMLNDILDGYESGGKVRPAGLAHKAEKSWVMDRFKESEPGKTHFDTGGNVPAPPGWQPGDAPDGALGTPWLKPGMPGWIPPTTGRNVQDDQGNPITSAGMDDAYTWANEWHGGDWGGAPDAPIGRGIAGRDNGIGQWQEPTGTVVGGGGQGYNLPGGGLGAIGPGHRILTAMFGGAVGYDQGGAAGDDPGDGGVGNLSAVKSLLSAESGRTPYVFGGYSPKGIDCSGLVAEAVQVYLGEPMSVGAHPMSTANEAAWLSARGFKQGTGSDGDFRVSFYNGGEGGGHTALTLPDGTNAESGGSGGGVRLGGGAAGAGSSEFNEHWYLPAQSVVSPGGYGGTGSGGSGGYGGAGGSGGGSGSGGGGTGASPAMIDSANSKVTAQQGKLDALDAKITEAQAAVDKAEGSKEGKGEKGAAAHEKRVSDAQATLAKLKDEKDQATGDLDSLTNERDNLTGDRDPKTLIAANDRITEATRRRDDAQAKLDRDQADSHTKQSTIIADQNELAKANDNIAKATQHLQDVQSKPAKKGKGESKDAQSTDFVDVIGKAGQDFLQGNLPQGFSDPTSWAGVKSAAALLKFGAGVAGHFGNKGAAGALTTFGDLLGGSGSGVAKDIATMVAGGTPGMAANVAAQGGQPVQDLVNQVPGYTPPSTPDLDSNNAGAQGDTYNIDRSAKYTGDITDMGAHQTAKNATDQRYVNRDIKQKRLIQT